MCLTRSSRGSLSRGHDIQFWIILEWQVEKVTSEEYTVDSDNLIERVKELLHEGNVTRIIVKNEKDDTLLEIPATVGVIGVVLVPWLAALGAIAAIATKCKIVVEKRE